MPAVAVRTFHYLVYTFLDVLYTTCFATFGGIMATKEIIRRIDAVSKRLQKLEEEIKVELVQLRTAVHLITAAQKRHKKKE